MRGNHQSDNEKSAAAGRRAAIQKTPVATVTTSKLQLPPFP